MTMLSTRLTIIAFLAATGFWTSDGQFYDVACPGVNSELQCPVGQLIVVQSMHTGDKSSADCANRKESATLFDEDSLHSGMIGFVMHICDGMERCRLPKPHEKMFVRSNTKDNFVQINYDCNEKSPDMLTTVACEGETAGLKCDTGTINIAKARFGRFDENTCTPEKPSKMTFCSSFVAEDFVTAKCQGKKQCNVETNVDDLGYAVYCDDKPKYLTVDYFCM